jgi:chromosome segregation ATPase
MSEQQPGEQGIRDRLSSAGEEAVGELTHNLLENPLFNQALVAALSAGERAMQAQRSAMTALNIPSSGEIERLERRLRSLSDRLEEVEDRLDEVSGELYALRRQLGAQTPRDQAGLARPRPGERS